MILGRVLGEVVASQKESTLQGLKLLVVETADHMGRSKGGIVVAADAVGAGVGELVLYASGSSARQTEATREKPVDAVIMAIVDLVTFKGETSFDKTKDG